MEFADYQIPYGIYFLNKTMPSVTISKDKIKFSKECFNRFGQCSHVEILYHPIYQTLAIRACETETDTSVCWKKENGGFVSQITVKAFATALYERMDWIKDYRFQFRGIFRERGNSRIIFFSLDEPRIYANAKKYIAELSETKYIQYTNGGNQEERESCFDAAYPIEWQKNVGLSCSMRKRRDRIADMITENDICVEGTCAVNPLIGEIPTKEAAQEELEALLIEM